MLRLQKIWVIAIIIAMLLFSSFTTVKATSGDDAENTWVTKASMPDSDKGMSAIAVNDEIFVIGISSNFKYTPSTDTWTSETPLPTSRMSFAIAYYQNKIFVLGGKFNGASLGDNEVYDTLTGTWQTLKPLFINVSSIDASVIDGKIFLIGETVNQVYDIATNSWTTKAPMPYPVSYFSSTSVDTKIYIIGGYEPDRPPEYRNQIQIYDTETDSWTLGAAIPTRVQYAACAATTGLIAPKRIYVIGGNGDGQEVDLIESTKNTFVYNPLTDNWTLGAPMPTARQGATAAVVNDKIYVFAGSPMAFFCGPYDINEEYTPIGYGKPDDDVIPEFGLNAVILLMSVTALSTIFLKKQTKQNSLFQN